MQVKHALSARDVLKAKIRRVVAADGKKRQQYMNGQDPLFKLYAVEGN